MQKFGEGQDEYWSQPDNAKANASFIVLAVNSYYRDQETIKGLLEALKDMLGLTHGNYSSTEQDQSILKARSAISHAEARQ